MDQASVARAEEAPQGEARSGGAVMFIRILAVLLLGVLFPAILLIEAYRGVDAVSETVRAAPSPEQYVQTFREVQKSLRTPSDYALYSQMFAEGANQAVVMHKQIMKVVVMQIGFSAMSLGLMFVMLGINDGGGRGKLTLQGVSWDFRTASTGALIFTIGAAMAASGGLLPNRYSTVPIAAFGPQVAPDDQVDNRQELSAAAYKKCKEEAPKEHFSDCFVRLFEQINEEQLR